MIQTEPSKVQCKTPFQKRQKTRALGFRCARKNDTKRVNAAPLSQRRMCAAFMMPGYAQRPGSAFHPRQFRDQSRAALSGKIGPKPLGLHTQSVLQLWKRHEMQKDPNEPGGEPTHVKASAL